MRLGRLITWRGVRRAFLAGWLTGGVAMIAGTVGCAIVAHNSQRDFQPIQTPLSPEAKAEIEQNPKHRRPEESTYLTFPEWYLVFNPQEYAEFVRAHGPSEFPWGRSIGQFWRGYAQVYAITSRHYPPDFGDNLMVVVIGVSSTGEWIVKGAYENTVGRAFEWVSGFDSQEDRYAAGIAREYGEFIPTRPWFEFPFGRALRGLWTKNEFFGPRFLRKCERKFFLSLEYGVKWGYASAMRAASHAVYGVAETEVFATARVLPESATTVAGVRKVKSAGNGGWIVALPHYQGFTDTVPVLARLGVEFDEVCGNDEILVTFLAPAGWSYNLPAGRPLFTMPLLTGDAQQRVAAQAPVQSLSAMLRELDRQGLKLEHLFDY